MYLLQGLSLCLVHIYIFTEHNKAGQPTDTGTRVCEVYGNVSVCVPLHSVTCSISFSAAGACNKTLLEEMFPQITKLLTTQAGATKLFPQPVHDNKSVWVISGR